LLNFFQVTIFFIFVKCLCVCASKHSDDQSFLQDLDKQNI